MTEMQAWQPPPDRRWRIDPEAASFGKSLATGLMLSLSFWLTVAWVVL